MEMYTDKPLTDLSAQCVLQFMKTNFKIHLIQKCPSLRNLEATVSWKIDTLIFHPRSIEIDNVIYKIGISRQYKNGENPKFIQRQNLEGGIDEDVDRYGFRRHETDDIDNPPADLESNEIHLRILEKEQAAERENAHTPYQLAALKRFDEEINERRAKILPHYLRRDGVEPPYTHYLQITVKKCDNGAQRVEHYSFNKTIAEARDDLVRKLFDNKSRRFEVKLLKMDDEFRRMSKLCLAFGPKKLKIRHLEIKKESGKMIKHFTPILNFPLEVLEISNINEYDSPLIKSTRKLIIHGSPSIISITNQRVHIEKNYFRIAKWASLIQNWRNNNYEIGRHYSINSREANFNFSSIRKHLRKLDGVRKGIIPMKNIECFVFELNKTSEMIFYKSFNAQDNGTLNIVIKPKGYAILN